MKVEVVWKDPEAKARYEQLVACAEAGHEVVLVPPKLEPWSDVPKRYKPDPDAGWRCVTCEGQESFKRSPESELPIRVDAETRRRLNL